MLTTRLVAAVFGEGRGDAALVGMPLIPAAALADGVTVAAGAVRAGWGWLRRRLAAGLRAAAEALDPLPVAQEVEADPWADPRWDERWTVAPAVEEAPAPVVLPMPSAAQVTAEEAPAVLPLRPAGEDLAELLAKHGTVRAAARALGVAESTLRSRCKRLGVQLPGRKGKR